MNLPDSRHLPVKEHAAPLDKPAAELDIMGDRDNRHPFPTKPGQKFSQRCLSLRIQSFRGLIQKQYLWPQ